MPPMAKQCVLSLELARPGDAVDDLVVDRHADVARVAKVPQRRRFRAHRLEHLRGDVVQVAGSHARLRLLLERSDRVGHDAARLAHDGNLARGFEDDGVVGGGFQVHRGRVYV